MYIEQLPDTAHAMDRKTAEKQSRDVLGGISNSNTDSRRKGWMIKTKQSRIKKKKEEKEKQPGIAPIWVLL